MPPTVEVLPGSDAQVQAQVTNRSGRPQRLRLEVAGRAGAWVRLAGSAGALGELALAPGAETTVPLVVSPPEQDGGAGQLVPFRIRVLCVDDPSCSTTVTGLVALAAPVLVQAALVPATSTSTRSASYRLELTTGQSTGLLVSLRGGPDRSIVLTVDPPAVRVEGRGATTATVTVRARRPVLLTPARHRIEVVWETDAAEGLARGSTRAAFVQRPALPRPVTVGLALALVLLLAAGGRLLVRTGLPLSHAAGAAGPTAVASSPRAAGQAGQSGPAGPAGHQGQGQGQPATTRPVTLPYVQLRSVFAGPDPAATRRTLEAYAAELASRGLEVRVVESEELPDQSQGHGFLAVVRDGFPDAATAARYCSDHRDVLPVCRTFA